MSVFHLGILRKAWTEDGSEIPEAVKWRESVISMRLAVTANECPAETCGSAP